MSWIYGLLLIGIFGAILTLILSILTWQNYGSLENGIRFDSLTLGLMGTAIVTVGSFGLMVHCFRLRKQLRTGIGFRLLEQEIYLLENPTEKLGTFSQVCGIAISCKQHQFHKRQFFHQTQFQHQAMIVWKSGKQTPLGTSQVTTNREQSWQQMFQTFTPLSQAIKTPLVSPSSDSSIVGRQEQVSDPSDIRWASAEQRVSRWLFAARLGYGIIFLVILTLVILALSR